jgi:hypothetical protein
MGEWVFSVILYEGGSTRLGFAFALALGFAFALFGSASPLPWRSASPSLFLGFDCCGGFLLRIRPRSAAPVGLVSPTFQILTQSAQALCFLGPKIILLAKRAKLWCPEEDLNLHGVATART